jgi:hypothetical protein
MGLFDGLFGGHFDFNGDGKTDPLEMGLGFAMLDELTAEEKAEQEDDLLVQTGYDSTELELMDPAQRRDILEDAGLDPADYGFDDDF